MRQGVSWGEMQSSPLFYFVEKGQVHCEADRRYKRPYTGQ